MDPAPTATAATGELSIDVVTAALRDWPAPRRDGDDPTGDAVRHVSVCGTHVAVQLAMEVSGAAELASVEEAVTQRIRSLGATEVQVLIRRPERSPTSTSHRTRAGGSAVARDPWAARVQLASVSHVVAVGAGKGGVGKSTVAINLALALAREGLRVGLLDADIYGPSLPILLGIEDGAARTRMNPERQILPIDAHGMPLVSFGFFLGEGSPAVWRGLMVSKAVRQFAQGVAWPALDLLVVDLPPGTGDVPLSLAQAIELSGAVVVTQPARVASAEARKAVRMFDALGVRVFGVVENMTGAFGAGAGNSVSAELGVPFLGEIPFDSEIVREGDSGTPTVSARPGSPAATAFDRIAQGVAEALGWRRVTTPECEPPAPPAAGSTMPGLPVVSPPDDPPRGVVVVADVSAGAPPSERRDLQDADLDDVLVAFYASVAEDPVLAPYFAELDMRDHMPRIVAFWSTLLFHTGRYSGNAFRPHLGMPGLTAAHFARWLATLERTVDARFVGERADGMKELAHRIAYSMQLRLRITPFAELRGGE